MKPIAEDYQIRTARFEAAPTAITTVAGLRLLMEVAQHVQLRQAIRRHIKIKKIASGFREEEFLLPLICNLALGRCDLNDITELRQDRELAKLIFGRPKLPSERRLSEHLAAYKDSDLAGLKRVNASLLDFLEPLSDAAGGRIPLDVDSSCFEQYGTKKEQMGRHYTGALGFNPVFAFIGRNGVALNSLLRPGNQKDSSGLEDFLKETVELLPPVLRSRLLARFDSGFYGRQNVTTLLNYEIDFIVKARLCDALRTAVTEELEAQRVSVEPMPYGADMYGEFTYQPAGWPKPLRYCFCLQIEEKEQDGQMLLIPRRQDLILATTLSGEEATAQQVFEAYRRRGRAEQFIKELKGPLNLEQLPTQSFRANEALLQSGLIAYNLMLLLEANWEGWQRKPGKKEKTDGVERSIGRRSLGTVKEKLLYCAATIIRHARKVVLKVAGWWLETIQPNRILERIRGMRPRPGTLPA